MSDSATYTSEEYYTYLHNHTSPTNTLGHHHATSPRHVNMTAGDVTLPRSGVGTSSMRHSNPPHYQHHQTHPRVGRKLSADSLMDYRTYQMEESGELMADQRYMMIMQGMPPPGGAASRLATGQKGSYPTLGTAAVRSRLHSQPQHSPQPQHQQGVADSIPVEAPTKKASVKDLQLSRKPLQIRPEDFRLYQPELEAEIKPDRCLNGVLYVHLYCGHGLKSSRTVLRDLYCVLELDGVNRARTMIRTGAINFDWDEEFDLDLETGRELSFLVYSWDPNTRHRLCFSGTICLHAFLEAGTAQKIALKLEPKGILYLDLIYKEPAATLQRTPSVRKSALFGISLETIIKREKTGDNVPIVVRRCIEEVEKRGLDHVGIYRLCGSSKRKLQLKEELEKNVRLVDFSVDNVSDINVITGRIFYVTHKATVFELSTARRQKGVTGYWFKYIDRPFCLRTDDMPFVFSSLNMVM